MVDWNDLDEFLDKDIGELREMLAYEDASKTIGDFLEENGWITRDTAPDDDEDYWEDDEDDEDDEDNEDDVETPSDLTIEEQDLVQSIANDINSGAYSIDTIANIYDIRIINAVEELI